MKPAFREKNQRGEDGGKWWAVSAPAIAGEGCAEAGDVARRSGARFPESAGQRAIGIARNLRRTRVARRARGRITSSIRVGRRVPIVVRAPVNISSREGREASRTHRRCWWRSRKRWQSHRRPQGRASRRARRRQPEESSGRRGRGGSAPEYRVAVPIAEKHHTHCGVSFFPEAMHRPRDARVRLTRGAKTPARSRRRRRRCASSRRRRARGERCPGLGS